MSPTAMAPMVTTASEVKAVQIVLRCQGVGSEGVFIQTGSPIQWPMVKISHTVRVFPSCYRNAFKGPDVPSGPYISDPNT